MLVQAQPQYGYPAIHCSHSHVSTEEEHTANPVTISDEQDGILSRKAVQLQIVKELPPPVHYKMAFHSERTQQERDMVDQKKAA